MAGANAALTAGCGGRSSRFVLGRDEAYIGVLVDDLVTRGVTEPYRMLSSRVEYRLLLRSDNADLRLSARGRAACGNLVSRERVELASRRKGIVSASLLQLSSVRTTMKKWKEAGVLPPTREYTKLQRITSAADVMRIGACLPDVERAVTEVRPLAVFEPTPPDARDTVEAQVLYQPMVGRLEQDMARLRGAQGRRIPPDLDYVSEGQELPGFPKELLERLRDVQPGTIPEAAQVPGITSSRLAELDRYLSARQRGRDRGRSLAGQAPEVAGGAERQPESLRCH